VKSNREIEERLAPLTLHWQVREPFGFIRGRVRASLIKTGRDNRMGEAICRSDDTFDEQEGREIALRRALVKAKAAGWITGEDIAYCMSGKPQEDEGPSPYKELIGILPSGRRVTAPPEKTLGQVLYESLAGSAEKWEYYPNSRALYERAAEAVLEAHRERGGCHAYRVEITRDGKPAYDLNAKVVAT
jgi:hypothetical protein